MHVSNCQHLSKCWAVWGDMQVAVWYSLLLFISRSCRYSCLCVSCSCPLAVCFFIDHQWWCVTTTNASFVRCNVWYFPYVIVEFVCYVLLHCLIAWCILICVAFIVVYCLLFTLSLGRTKFCLLVLFPWLGFWNKKEQTTLLHYLLIWVRWLVILDKVNSDYI